MKSKSRMYKINEIIFKIKCAVNLLSNKKENPLIFITKGDFPLLRRLGR